MSKYPLEQLLTVLKIKQDNAQLALQKAKENVKHAQKALKEAQKKLEEYKEWRPKEEERLFQKVMKKKVKNENVTDIKTEIGHLRDKEVALGEKVKEAQAHLEEMEKAVEEARKVYQEAVNRVTKIGEHENTWQAEHRKEQEALADKEMEEFTRKNESPFE